MVEVGTYRGKLTGQLVKRAAEVGGEVASIDPVSQAEPLELEKNTAALRLVTRTSHEALADLPRPDALILDGDHNYYTLSEELRLIAERAPGAELPLLLLHDVAWPLGRRDSYADPVRIPEGHRQPFARNVSLVPGDAGVTDHGMPFACVAVREGGPRNGVLTAIEDFMEANEGLRLAIVPAFFGLGVLWHSGSPWADAVARVIEPWDRNPLLERLESNRTVQVAERWANAARLQADQRRHRQQDALLRSMLESSAFALAERLSRLRQRGDPTFSREKVRQALNDAKQ